MHETDSGNSGHGGGREIIGDVVPSIPPTHASATRDPSTSGDPVAPNSHSRKSSAAATINRDRGTHSGTPRILPAPTAAVCARPPTLPDRHRGGQRHRPLRAATVGPRSWSRRPGTAVDRPRRAWKSEAPTVLGACRRTLRTSARSRGPPTRRRTWAIPLLPRELLV